MEDCTFVSLQCLTLIVQMAVWLPYTSNLWYTSGEAMRIAIALGLHQEPPDSGNIDLDQIKLRRNVFWTVYYLERTIAVGPGCPLAINDEHISTPLPSSADLIDGDPGVQNVRKANQFLGHIQLSRLQSEIHGVQFFDRDLPAETPVYADWIRKMETSIQFWQESLQCGGDIPGWVLSAADHCRLLLYRPCSRNIEPDDVSLRAAYSISVKTINRHWVIVRAGGLIFPLQYVFNIFQAGMVLLYALSKHCPLFLNPEMKKEAKEALELLPPLFDALSTRWPAAADTGSYVKELKETVLQDIQSSATSERSASDTNLLAELDFMVTQRRVHSIYHRNVEAPGITQQSQPGTSPWNYDTLDSAESDNLWQELIDTNFLFYADDSPLYIDSFEMDQSGPWDNNCTVEDTATAQKARSDSAANIETLIRTLPACGYCRTRHVKCGQEFPSCGACLKSNRECLYYDALLQIDVPRRYVYELYTKFRAILDGSGSYTLPTCSIPPVTQDNQGIFLLRSGLGSIQSSIDQPNLGIRHSVVALDNCFLGPSSSLMHLKRALSITPALIPQLRHNYEPWSFQSSVNMDYPEPYIPPQHLAITLFEVFSRSVNVYFPTIKDDHMKSVLSTVYTDYSVLSSTDSDIFNLILAIASNFSQESRSFLPFSPCLYFRKAVHHPSKSRADWISIDPLILLQRTLLICIYLLFSPDSGDIWRNLGFAIRLYFDLSHRPSEHDDMDEDLMTMLFRSLYCLECQVSVAFGRPSLLVIGDKLRASIIKPIFHLVEDRVSSYFYRISLLKMQIQSSIISASCIQSHTLSNEEHRQIYEIELESWLSDWKAEVVSRLGQDHTISSETLSTLEAWANLNYHHAAFLMMSLSESFPETTTQHCDEIIRSCTLLTRHQRKSMLPRSLHFAEGQHFDIVFPMNWTLSHLLFSVGLSIQSSSTWSGVKTSETLGLARRCLTALALLESDSSMLSTGFTEILEALYFGAEP